MSRNTLINEPEYTRVIRSKRTNGKRHPTTAVILQELSQELMNSQQMYNHAQQQIKLLNEHNTNLKYALTELAHKEAQARHLAYHDGLTALPNRNLLQDRFHQAISQAERHHKLLALLMVDLDGFKYVNDNLGHSSGDKLLQAVAQRLTTRIRSADTACRYGGDEFVIMLPEIDNPNIAATLAVEIGKRLSDPYIIDDNTIQIAVSVGIAVFPGDGLTFEALMNQADIAMYQSKGTGHSTSITTQPMNEVHSLFIPCQSLKVKQMI